MARETVMLFPAKSNVGNGKFEAQPVPVNLAEKLIKSKKWSAVATPRSKDDIAYLLQKSQEQIGSEKKELDEAREMLLKEREELEALRAELVTSKKTKNKEV